jgi:DNA polymerase-3 subunit gamma/tau
MGSARGRLAAGDDGQTSTGRPGGQRAVAPADDEPSADDADADDSGLVGRPVVERLLGGRVIDETSA